MFRFASWASKPDKDKKIQAHFHIPICPFDFSYICPSIGPLLSSSFLLSIPAATRQPHHSCTTITTPRVAAASPHHTFSTATSRDHHWRPAILLHFSCHGQSKPPPHLLQSHISPTPQLHTVIPSSSPHHRGNLHPHRPTSLSFILERHLVSYSF